MKSYFLGFRSMILLYQKLVYNLKTYQRKTKYAKIIMIKNGNILRDFLLVIVNIEVDLHLLM